MPIAFLSLSFLALTACESAEKETPIEEVSTDADADGFRAEEDCDDTDPLINSAATEVCDGIDNDCDGSIDEDVTLIFFVDSDDDGFGNPDITIEACENPIGFVDSGNDCDDSRSDVYPGAEEICDDRDNNCDEDIDEGLHATYYIDEDGDGFGDPLQEIQACALRDGISIFNEDCDDQNESIHPLQQEQCDGIDNNCDENIDEGVQNTYYEDKDGDGFGDDSQVQEACAEPQGYTDRSGDCDDLETYANPFAIEICDDIDNDCDGDIDEQGAAGSVTYYTDVDGDGFGDDGTEAIDCSVPVGSVLQGGDCDDTEATANPAMVELCDGLDNNCDGLIDDSSAINPDTFYLDGDGDGFGDANSIQESCSVPAGYVDNSEDCNDGNDAIHPDQSEICSTIGVDDNCDGLIDDSTAIDQMSYYLDDDGDGFGASNSTQESCSVPAGYVENSEDCDDSNNAIHPDQSEMCSTIGVDDNCDGDIDDSTAIDATLWYPDVDEDGYGDPALEISACLQPTAHLSDGSDCNDSEAASNPGATEICDGIDNDCDGGSDESDEVYGTNETCPGTSCLDIFNEQAAASDGFYWIDPDALGAYEVECDMTTDGGGWTLIVSANSTDIADDPPDFTYNSSIWTEGYNSPNDSTHVSSAWFRTPAFTQLNWYEDTTSYIETASNGGNLSDWAKTSGTIHINENLSCSYGPCGGRIFRTYHHAICNTGNGSTSWGMGLGPIRSCQSQFGTLYYEFSNVGFDYVELWIR